MPLTLFRNAICNVHSIIFVLKVYNINEISLLFYILFVIFQHKKAAVYTLLIALIATTMTWSKTVLYFLMSSKLCLGDHFVTGLPWSKFVFMFVIPNGLWIVLPLFCMVSLVLQLAQLLQKKEKKS